MNSQPRIAIPLGLADSIEVPRGTVRTLRGTTMGTSWSVQLICSDAMMQAASRTIDAALERVIAQMSPWRGNSNLSQFNNGPIGEWHQLPDDFAFVTEAALRIAELSNGTYNPASGALVDMWGFGAVSPETFPPSDELIQQALHHGGWKALEWDKANRRLRRHAPVRLDCNGIAKGYAVDLVMNRLNEIGIRHALVDIGGELRGCGIKPDQHPWWVTIAQPNGTDVQPLMVALHGLAIATSGTERSRAHAGRHYSHTIDPQSGFPINNGMITASVIHPSCMEADAWATVLMVAGRHGAEEFANRHQIAAVWTSAQSADGPLIESVSPFLAKMLED